MHTDIVAARLIGPKEIFAGIYEDLLGKWCKAASHVACGWSARRWESSPLADVGEIIVGLLTELRNGLPGGKLVNHNKSNLALKSSPQHSAALAAIAAVQKEMSEPRSSTTSQRSGSSKRSGSSRGGGGGRKRRGGRGRGGGGGGGGDNNARTASNDSRGRNTTAKRS